MGVMTASWMIYRRHWAYGAVEPHDGKQLRHYYTLCYLRWGFVSFVWSTNPGFSALQWFMTVQKSISVFLYQSLFLLDEFFRVIRFSYISYWVTPLYSLSQFRSACMAAPGCILSNDQRYGEEAPGRIIDELRNELGMLSGIGIALSLV